MSFTENEVKRIQFAKEQIVSESYKKMEKYMFVFSLIKLIVFVTLALMFRKFEIVVYILLLGLIIDYLKTVKRNKTEKELFTLIAKLARENDLSVCK